MRIILYTGKGGVGKTTVAAATACRLADEGKRVLIMSTDQAHSLGDSFGRKIGQNPLQICTNLDAVEIDVIEESAAVWGNLQGYMKELLVSKAAGGLEVEELLVFPGLEELFSLFKILDVYEQGSYDVLIVDCAPTGETMALLKFPDLFGGFLEKMLPGKRKAVRTIGPAVEKITKIPMPKDGVFSDVERMMNRLERLQELLLDHQKVSLRIVTTPEKIVIAEAKRNFTCLHLYDYNVDAVIVNKVYPHEALQGYFHKWQVLQEEGIAELRESFSEIPLFYLPLQQGEIRGISGLRHAGKLFGDRDPDQVLFQKRIFTLEQREDEAELMIDLPFADKEEMELTEQGGELIISIKNEKRRILLPDRVRRMDVVSAKYQDGIFYIRLKKPDQ